MSHLLSIKQLSMLLAKNRNVTKIKSSVLCQMLATLQILYWLKYRQKKLLYCFADRTNDLFRIDLENKTIEFTLTEEEQTDIDTSNTRDEMNKVAKEYYKHRKELLPLMLFYNLDDYDEYQKCTIHDTAQFASDAKGIVYQSADEFWNIMSNYKPTIIEHNIQLWYLTQLEGHEIDYPEAFDSIFVNIKN